MYIDNPSVQYPDFRSGFQDCSALYFRRCENAAIPFARKTRETRHRPSIALYTNRVFAHDSCGPTKQKRVKNL